MSERPSIMGRAYRQMLKLAVAKTHKPTELPTPWGPISLQTSVLIPHGRGLAQWRRLSDLPDDYVLQPGDQILIK